MRPSDAWKKRLQIVMPNQKTASLDSVLNNAEMIDRLAVAIEQGIDLHSKNGTVDLREVAAHVLHEVLRNQK